MGKKLRLRIKVVVVMIYEGGRRIPGAEEEGAVAGEVIGEGEQNRRWQCNAPKWHCTATSKTKESTYTNMLSQWRSYGTSIGRVSYLPRVLQFVVC